MPLYFDSGYVNIGWVLSLGLPFNAIWGGRGTGKTYNALREMVTGRHKFMYVRRTQTQTDLINDPKFNPFKTLNAQEGWDIMPVRLTKYNSGFYHMENVGDAARPAGEPIGYTAALSTFANIRGFDMSDINVIIFDEFIPEKHERPLPHEASAFFNMIETVNRNRELQGRPPVQVVCLANANDLANPLFMELGIVRKAEKMEKNGQEMSLLRDRGLGLFNLQHSPISARKADTALYKLTEGSSFADMAINNRFEEERGRIRPAPLKEYRPVVVFGELCIYEHKSGSSLYITEHVSGSPRRFGIGEADTHRFIRQYGWIWQRYLMNEIEFEDYGCEILFMRYYKGVR